MIFTSFDPEEDLIIVSATVRGPHHEMRLRLAVDTAASLTLIATEVIDQIGLGARQGTARTILRSAIGEEPAYLIKVPLLQALGYDFPDFLVHSHDLPEAVGIDGLIGLNLRRQFNYEVRSGEGRILLNTSLRPSPSSP